MEFITAIVWLPWVVSIALYVYFAYCLQTIAGKTDTENGWLAWIPIANAYLMCKIAGRPGWWLALFFIPIANIVFMIIAWMGITEARDKDKWLGVLMMVPIANLVLLGYLAFSGEDTESSEAKAQVNPAMQKYPAPSGGITRTRAINPQTNLAALGHSAPSGGTAKVRAINPQTNLVAPGYPAPSGGATKAREIEPQAKKENEEAQKAAVATGSETQGSNVRLVIPSSVGFSRVALLKEHLKGRDDLMVVMTGGSVDEGSIIVVSGQESADLLHTLNQMPVVQDAQAKGADIMVKLKPANA